ncbi:MAG: TonB family protein [Ferruginibacter sp.]|nr:TonB family protein [Cytophagales bacterium]
MRYRLLLAGLLGAGCGGSAKAQPYLSSAAQAVVEQIPEYRFGMEGLAQHLEKHLRYPRPARKSRLEGTVYVGFLVDSTGVLRDFTVDQGLGGGCDEEAVRLLRSTSPWVPGRKEGRPIATRCVVPVRFER